MTGKAKPKKHASKEIAAKVDATLTNRGRGKAEFANRTGKEKGGHAKFEFPLCRVTLTNRGRGKAEFANRTGKEKGGHAKFEFPLCRVTALDIKSMQIHHDVRYPNIMFNESKINNVHVDVAPVVAKSSKPKLDICGSLKK